MNGSSNLVVVPEREVPRLPVVYLDGQRVSRVAPTLSSANTYSVDVSFWDHKVGTETNFAYNGGLSGKVVWANVATTLDEAFRWQKCSSSDAIVRVTTSNPKVGGRR
jgi:hypothetical protein